MTINNSNKLLNRLVISINQQIDFSREMNQKRLSDDEQIRNTMTNLTHDIKTPLAVASGYTQLLEQSATKDQKTKLDRISINLTSIDKYLATMMDFNILNERRINFTPTDTNISELLTNSLLSFYDTFENSQITPVINIAENQYLLTDATLLTRVFQNLFGNVAKYGSKTVYVLLESETKDSVKIILKNRVSDPSIAMKMTTLMDRYKTTKPQTSQGLGLQITSSILKQLNSSISTKWLSSSNEFEVVLNLQSVTRVPDDSLQK
ncbi:sensor histidine kinase [Pediococcus argentinicus]|uniref:histidine kinase n=1 Tax=Pediococcus argentinicus TaxID=480391 RepID=A0A0R2NJD0_9LACO|nr:signal transduction histidine kinase [Pediococcus argentinicus]